MVATAIARWPEEVAQRVRVPLSTVTSLFRKASEECTSPAAGCQVRFAHGRDEFERAYRLVYQRYRERGYLARSGSGIRYHPRLGLPDSRTIVALRPVDRLLGTVSLVFDGEHGLPIESAFETELNRLRGSGRRVAEAISLAVSGCRKVRSRSLYFALTRFLIQYARYREIDDLVIAVHPHHARFYCKLLGFEPLGSCRPYGAVRGHPAIACRLSLADFSQSNPLLRKFYLSHTVPPEHFEQPTMRPRDHAYFLRRLQCHSRAA